MGFPKLRFLRRGHACNYCQRVNGVTFRRPPKVEPRLYRIPCICGKKHYVCRGCLAGLQYKAEEGHKGQVDVRLTVCAKGYSKEKKGAQA